MKVAVFGSTGFVGRKITELLNLRGIAHLGVSRSKTSDNHVAVDFTIPASFDSIPPDVDSAIICSAKLPQRTYTIDDTRAFIDDNVHGLISILDWASRRNVKRLVYCSTLSMVPSPSANGPLIDTRAHAVYKISKAAAEHLFANFCANHSIDFTVLRIASVYGAGMKPDVLKTIIDAVRTGGAFTLSNRNVVVDFVHVQDVAQVAVDSLNNAGGAGYINVSAGTPISMIDICSIIERIIGSKLTMNVQGAAPLDYRVHDTARFRELLGRDPWTLEEGLQELIHSYRS